MNREDISSCKSCGAKIVWMKTKKGKNIPVDFTEKVRVFLDFTTPRPLTFNHKTMTSHFATCPQADQHRKPREERQSEGEYE